jgi:hypothetical protein
MGRPSEATHRSAGLAVGPNYLPTPATSAVQEIALVQCMCWRATAVELSDPSSHRTVRLQPVPPGWLFKFLFSIPLSRDSDGGLHPSCAWSWLHDSLFALPGRLQPASVLRVATGPDPGSRYYEVVCGLEAVVGLRRVLEEVPTVFHLGDFRYAISPYSGRDMLRLAVELLLAVIRLMKALWSVASSHSGARPAIGPDRGLLCLSPAVWHFVW